MVRFLLGQGADASARDKGRWTLLHLAAREGSIDIAEASLADHDVNLKSRDGYTPLILAACNGHVGMVQFLIQRGADVHAVDNLKYTALLDACEEGHAEVINVLVQHGVDVNGEEPLRPLSFAATSGEVAAVQALLDAGADPTGVSMKYLRLRCPSESIRQLVENAQKAWSSRLEVSHM
jgi:ankyrin repeat protein